MHETISLDKCMSFATKRLRKLQGYKAFDGGSFSEELLFLEEFLETQNDRVFIHKQVMLPASDSEAHETMEAFLATALDLGGEGVVIRSPRAEWTPKRHAGLLKYKPFEDSEAQIVGFVSGKEGKQGQALGKIGALIVRWGDKTFKIGSGMTLADREFKDALMEKHATENPEENMPANFEGKYLGRGDTITFKYRELTDDGIPKEARYWRRRDAE